MVKLCTLHKENRCATHYLYLYINTNSSQHVSVLVERCYRSSACNIPPLCCRHPKTKTSPVGLQSSQPRHRVLSGLQQDRRHRPPLPGRGGGLLVLALHPGVPPPRKLLHETDDRHPG